MPGYFTGSINLETMGRTEVYGRSPLMEHMYQTNMNNFMVKALGIEEDQMEKNLRKVYKNTDDYLLMDEELDAGVLHNFIIEEFSGELLEYVKCLVAEREEQTKK